MTGLFATASVAGVAQSKESRKELRSELKAEKKVLREIRANEVGKMSKNQFSEDFGSIPNVSWDRVKTFDVATFKKDGQAMKAYYDHNSQLVGTTTVVSSDNLPAAAQKRIAKKYGDYTIAKVQFFKENEAYENDEDMVMYGVPVEHLDHYFVELKKEQSTLVLMVSTRGDIKMLKQLK